MKPVLILLLFALAVFAEDSEMVKRKWKPDRPVYADSLWNYIVPTVDSPLVREWKEKMFGPNGKYPRDREESLSRKAGGQQRQEVQKRRNLLVGRYGFRIGKRTIVEDNYSPEDELDLQY